MYANRRNLRVVKKIGVEEHDGDVRFQTGSENTAVSRMRNEKYAIRLFLAESPKLDVLKSRNTTVRSDFRQEVEI